MSAWKCLLYALVCCLDSHTLKWSVGVVFIDPNTKLAAGEKLLLSAAHRTVRCPCPVRLAVRLTPQVTVGAAGFPDVTLDSPVASLHQCHLELAVGLLFPGAPNSLACGIGQSGVLARTVRLATLVFVSWTCLILVDIHL
jgi:hypothetical protein